METLLSALAGFTAWLLRTSCQTTVVIGLVLVAQWLLQKKLSPRWRYGLWSLVLIRLMLPVLPGSSFSVFNYTQGVGVLAPETGRSAAALPAESAPAASLPPAAVRTASGPAPGASSARLDSPASSPQTAPQRPFANSTVEAPPLTSTLSPSEGARVPEGRVRGDAPRSTLRPLHAWLALLWLSGALFLLARIIWFPLRLNAELARHETATGPAVFDILEQSKRLIGVNQVLPIIQSRAVTSPALLGFIRPWLLLPEGMVGRFTAEELRFVFLHELAHLKRRDILVNWLMTILQILHWFNPLVWLAFSRMRADRELACDELALSFAKADETKSYGQAIIKLLEDFTRPAVLPGLVGILEDKQQMKRRITMIAQFKQMTPWSAVALTLLLTLGLLTLTDAQSGKGTDEQTAKSNRRVPAKAQFQIWACPVEVVPSTTSTDGRYLSYIDYNTGDVGVRDLVAGVSRHLTKASWELREFGGDSAMSPDGKDVAYGWFNKDTYELRIVGLDGAAPRVFYQNSEVTYYYPYAWSPDKKFVLTTFYRKDGTRQLALVSPQDGSTRILKSFDWRSPQYPSFSPDGRWILYSFQTKEAVKQNDIFLLATDGSREIPLVQGPANDVALAWAPDGKNVLFVSDRGGSEGLWLIGVNEGQPQGTPQLIKPDVGTISPIGMTEKGSFYYCMLVGQNDVYTGDLDLTTGRLASTPQLVSQRFVGFNSVPTWSPDGESIAYIATRSGSIVLHSFKTDEERELPTKMSFRFELAWSPDGRMLLASASDAKGRGGIYQIDAQTGQTSLVVQGGSSSTEARTWGWLPDGKSIFYNRGGIVRRNLETGEEQELFVNNTDSLRFVTLSPDGRQFAAWTGDASKKQQIVLIPTDKSKPRELLRVDDAVSEQTIGGTPPGLAWTPDGKYVVFGKRVNRDTSTDLWRVNIESGKPEKIGTVTSRVHGIVVHPHGNRIAYSTREDKLEVWAMENFLPNEEKEQAFSIRQVWGGSKGYPGGPSPDGRYLTYTDGRDLAIREIATGEHRRLTQVEAVPGVMALFGRFSPDGRQIVYTQYRKDALVELRLVDVDGSKPRVLYSNPEIGNIYPNSWSPDGRAVVAILSKLDGAHQLATVSTIDGSARILKTFDWQYLDNPCFSPDGRHIAYDSNPEKKSHNHNIFVLAADGSRELPLMQNPADDHFLGWAPDGKHVLFASDRTGTMDAWVIGVVDGKPQGPPVLVKSSVGQVTPLGFTSRGSFYLEQGSRRIEVYVSEFDPVAGKILGSPVSAIKRFLQLNSEPDWSLNGQYLAYVSYRGQVPQEQGASQVIVIRSATSGQERELSLKSNELSVYGGSSLRWTPDGKGILVLGYKKNQLGFYEIDAGTGQVRPLLEAGTGVSMTYFIMMPSISPDGKAVFYIRNDFREKLSRILVRDLKTGQDNELYRGPESSYLQDLALSPDGERLAFTVDGRLKVMPALGGQAHEILLVKKPETIAAYLMAWTPDGQYLLFGKGGAAPERVELCRILAEGGQPQSLGLAMNNLSNLRVHPDGRRVAFEAGESKSDIWVMENFLPKEKLATK